MSCTPIVSSHIISEYSRQRMSQSPSSPTRVFLGLEYRTRTRTRDSSPNFRLGLQGTWDSSPNFRLGLQGTRALNPNFRFGLLRTRASSAISYDVFEYLIGLGTRVTRVVLSYSRPKNNIWGCICRRFLWLSVVCMFVCQLFFRYYNAAYDRISFFLYIFIIN